jgi:hypothetical protein
MWQEYLADAQVSRVSITRARVIKVVISPASLGCRIARILSSIEASCPDTSLKEIASAMGELRYSIGAMWRILFADAIRGGTALSES